MHKMLWMKERGENAYLRHLTYEGAKKRYGEITKEISERLDFELTTIENTGYPGYFLIVQDFSQQEKWVFLSVLEEVLLQVLQ